MDIKTSEQPPKWNAGEVDKSLEEIHDYIDREARAWSAWYFKNKKWKKLWSQGLRFVAVVLAALAGLVPIAASLGGALGIPILARPSGLWAPLFLGAAAAMVGLDRAFGFSSSWMRYVKAGTAIHTTLDEFRIKWVALRAGAARPSQPPATELIQCANSALADIKAHVLDEMQLWEAEFQKSLSQLEYEARQQVETGRIDDQMKKVEAAQRLASNRGLEVTTMPRAVETNETGVRVAVTGPDGVKIEESLQPGHICKVEYGKQGSIVMEGDGHRLV